MGSQCRPRQEMTGLGWACPGSESSCVRCTHAEMPSLTRHAHGTHVWVECQPSPMDWLWMKGQSEYGQGTEVSPSGLSNLMELSFLKWGRHLGVGLGCTHFLELQ